MIITQKVTTENVSFISYKSCVLKITDILKEESHYLYFILFKKELFLFEKFKFNVFKMTQIYHHFRLRYKISSLRSF
jgi:hypothetical protein